MVDTRGFRGRFVFLGADYPTLFVTRGGTREKRERGGGGQEKERDGGRKGG